MGKRIFITVGEVSGDNHAAGLVAALKQLDPTLIVEGIGGPKMAAAGATIHHETTRRAAMTLHAWKRVAEIKRLETWLRQRYAGAEKPDLHICVDSSGFNLRFAKLAKSVGVPTLYYVAPQLWASREGRIKQMRAAVDALAVIFPFEEKWFRDRGLNATFVGHPLFDALPENRFERTPRMRYPDRAPVIGVVAGSRRSEVTENFPGLLEVMHTIARQHPTVRFLLPTTPAGDAVIRERLGAAAATPRGVETGSVSSDEANRARADSALLTTPPTLDCVIKQDAFDELIPQCDLVLCKSGTSTVHVAAYGVPMIVVYRISTLLWHAAGRWLIKTPKMAMVNILAGNVDLVPEFIPWNGDPAPVSAEALRMLREPSLLTEMHQKLVKLIEPLDRRGASTNVARLALSMLNRDA
jgi:lipid-A-disaccharide synthase